ncbi:MAG: hypothetical protein Q4C72_07880 [Eubacteriales bacterium]|nr:hypothetical protein [Eubacteriales bacterium]
MEDLYTALQAVMETRFDVRDGPETQRLGEMQSALDALLPHVLHRRFRRLCDQSNAAGAEWGHACFSLGVRCGLLLLSGSPLEEKPSG